MPKFSIIIPCYNSYKHMKDCLQHFENQTFKDFELVIIDDCSKDESFENLIKYKENSKLHIKLLKNEQNLGPGETRNVGIENASGEFVLFVDADDYIESNALEIFDKIILENEVDCIIFDYFYKTPNYLIYQKSISKVEQGKIDKSEALIYSTGSVCGKVFLLENILKNSIRFPNFKRNEDMPFNKLTLASSSNIYYCEQALYFYIKNEESAMNNIQKIDFENAKNAFHLIEKNLKEKYPKEVEAIFIVEFLYSSTMTLVERKEKNKDIKNHIKQCEERYPDLYTNEVIQNLPKHQRICIKQIKNKRITFLRILQFLRNLIKKIR